MESTTTLEDLLERLVVLSHYVWGNILTEVRSRALELDEDEAHDIVQVTVQRAIEARKWSWMVRTRTIGNYAAEIPSRQIYAEGLTPAHALLAAYIKALEAEQREVG